MKDFIAYKKIGFLPPSTIISIQERLLSRHLEYCITKSPYYRNLFKAYKIDFTKINLHTLHVLPFTEKADIEQHNEEFVADGSKNKIADIVLSSGTTGKAIEIFYTEHDLQRLAYNEEKSFSGCGFTDKDVVLLTCTLDRCFVAGLAYYLGIRALGGTTIRNGINNLESHADIIRRMNPTAVVGVPSFLKKLGLYLSMNGIDPHKAAVSKLVCIGEALRGEDMKILKIGQDLEDIWGAKAYSTYSSSEIVTTFCECTSQAGGHLHPDLAVIEVVGEKGDVLKPGEKGEVVVTPLGVKGMPLVRFKTGDISFTIDKPCTCANNTLRLGPILSRKNQMIKAMGTTIYPQTIYSALEDIEGISEYYIVLTNGNGLSETIEVHCALDSPRCTPGAIQEKLQARLRIRPRVYIDDEESIRRQVYTSTSRKPTRFIDKR